MDILWVDEEPGNTSIGFTVDYMLGRIFMVDILKYEL